MKKKCLKIVVDLYLDDIIKEYLNIEGTINKVDKEDIHCNDECHRCSCDKFCGILGSDPIGFYANYKKVNKYLIKRIKETI